MFFFSFYARSLILLEKIPRWSSNSISTVKQRQTIEGRDCGLILMEENLTLAGKPQSKPQASEKQQKRLEGNMDNGDQAMPDAAQNPNSRPSDGSQSECESGSESDSDDEAQQKLQLQSLEAELSSNPSNYDSHVQVGRRCLVGLCVYPI